MTRVTLFDYEGEPVELEVEKDRENGFYSIYEEYELIGEYECARDADQAILDIMLDRGLLFFDRTDA